MKARKRINPKKPAKPAAKTATAKKKGRAIKPSGKRASSKASDADFEDPPTAKRKKPRSTDTRSDERPKPGARSRSADAEQPSPKKARVARDTRDEDPPKARAPEDEDLEADEATDAGVDDESDDGDEIEDAEEDVDSASEADEAAREAPLMSDISEIRGARFPDEAGADPQLIEGDVDLDVLDIAADSQPTPTTRSHLKRVIESLIFVADSAITANQLARIVKAKAAEVKEVVQEIARDFEGRGVELVEVSGGYQFRSAAASAPFVRDLVAHRPVRLTRAQLETLALIAYRQPITRPEIDDVRGVDSGSAIKVLLDRELVKILGRKDEAGRPLLYGTAPQFLDFFGMKSLQDLPTLREFTELTEENRELFAKKMGEVPEDLSDPALDPVVVHAFDEDDEDSVRPPPGPGTELETGAEADARVDPESGSEAESAANGADDDELESAGEPHAASGSDDDTDEADVSAKVEAEPPLDEDASDADFDDELGADATLEADDPAGALEPDESDPDAESSEFISDASDDDDDDSSRPT